MTTHIPPIPDDNNCPEANIFDGMVNNLTELRHPKTWGKYTRMLHDGTVWYGIIQKHPIVILSLGGWGMCHCCSAAVRTWLSCGQPIFAFAVWMNTRVPSAVSLIYTTYFVTWRKIFGVISWLSSFTWLCCPWPHSVSSTIEDSIIHGGGK